MDLQSPIGSFSKRENRSNIDGTLVSPPCASCLTLRCVSGSTCQTVSGCGVCVPQTNSGSGYPNVITYTPPSDNGVTSKTTPPAPNTLAGGGTVSGGGIATPTVYTAPVLLVAPPNYGGGGYGGGGYGGGGAGDDSGAEDSANSSSGRMMAPVKPTQSTIFGMKPINFYIVLGIVAATSFYLIAKKRKLHPIQDLKTLIK